MALNIVPFALCLLFIYRCIYGFWTLYGKFTVELQTGCWILFHKILLQSNVVVAIHSLTVCTLYSLHSSRPIHESKWNYLVLVAAISGPECSKVLQGRVYAYMVKCLVNVELGKDLSLADLSQSLI